MPSSVNPGSHPHVKLTGVLKHRPRKESQLSVRIIHISMFENALQLNFYIIIYKSVHASDIAFSPKVLLFNFICFYSRDNGLTKLTASLKMSNCCNRQNQMMWLLPFRISLKCWQIKFSLNSRLGRSA